MAVGGRRRGERCLLRQIIELANPPGRCDPGLQRGGVLGQLHDRAGQAEGVEQEGDQAWHVEVALLDAPGAEGQDRDRRDLDAGPREGPGERLAADRADAVIHRRPGVVEQRVADPLLGAGGLDGAQRADRPLESSAEPADVLLGLLLRLRDHRHQDQEEHRDHGDHRDRRAEQDEIEHTHQDQRADQHHDAVEEADEARRGGLAQQHGVGGDAGHQLAGRPLGDRSDRRAEVAADHLDPRVEHDPLADRAQGDPHDQAGGGADHDQPGEQQHRAGHRLGVAERGQDVAGDHRRGQLGCRRADRQQQTEQQHPTVGAGEPQQEAQANQLRRGQGGVGRDGRCLRGGVRWRTHARK